ncbi:MAG: hypothetical protein LBJ44_11010 [Propionibacteriaceae bacterium]|jgi:hypothetical protein|nr:hypothetical protein [Propionibacteriaceae bacterium]
MPETGAGGWRKRIPLLGLLLASSLALGPTALAQADSPADQLAQLQSQQADLAQRQAEAQARLDQADSQWRLSQQELEQGQERLAVLRGQVAETVLRQWQGRALTGPAVLLTSPDATTLLRQLVWLSQTGQTFDAMVRRLEAERANLIESQAALEAARVVAQAERAELDRLSTELEAKVAAARRLLGAMASTRPVGGADGLTAQALRVRQIVAGSFPGIASIGGYRAGSSGDHGAGLALDVMIPDWGAASGQALGQAVADWARDNARALGIHYVIFRQRIWNVEVDRAGWRPMADRGSATANHYDHVHISLYP